MPSPGVIELDRSEAWEPPERPEWARRPTGRSVAVVAVLVAVLALVAGADRTVPPAPPVLLPGDGVGSLHIDGDALFLIRRLDPAHTVVESYRTSDGGRRWSSAVATSSELVEVDAGRVVLTVLRPGEESTHTLIALDAASGSQVWSRTDVTPSLYGSAGGTGVVVAEPHREGSEQGRSSGQLMGIDTVTGDIRWSLVTPAGTVRSFVSVDGDLTRGRVEIAEVDPRGVLRLRSAESGAVVRTVTLDRPGEVDGFDVARGRLLAYRFGDRETGGRGMRAATVFDLETGGRLWQRTAEPGGVPLWWWWCGHTVCAGTETEIALLDAGSGRQLSRLDGWTNVDPLGEDRLLVTRSTPTGEQAPAGLVIDAATGRVVRRIDDSNLVIRPALPTVLLSARTLTGPVRIAHLDVDTGRMTVLGRAGQWGIQPRCVATKTVLACSNGPVSIWRIP